MPLAFQSINYGTVAFGFFNIETDMLLLENYFFFASDFCEHISVFAKTGMESDMSTNWDGYRVDHPDEIGDLMGAIHGNNLTGFIGDVYRRFPFPSNLDHFKQNTDGFKTRKLLKNMIEKYENLVKIPFIVEKDKQAIGVGRFKFSYDSFCGLILYVEKGGYPCWKEGLRPDYVLAMMEKIKNGQNPVFKKLRA